MARPKDVHRENEAITLALSISPEGMKALQIGVYNACCDLWSLSFPGKRLENLFNRLYQVDQFLAYAQSLQQKKETTNDPNEYESRDNPQPMAAREAALFGYE